MSGRKGANRALQRLVLTFKPAGLEARALHRSTPQGPGTEAARRREVTTLIRTGLERALEVLDAGGVWTSGRAGSP